MSPSGASLDDRGTSSSDEYHSRIYTATSRKRRKLSFAESGGNESPEEANLFPGKAPLPSISRIKVHTKQSNANGPFVLEETEISNGKVVDAKSSFASLEVSPWLVVSLAAMAIRRPTAIQKGCIPEIFAGRNVIGGSRTGSGKTVAFAVPILQKWAEDPMGIFALILTPTR